MRGGQKRQVVFEIESQEQFLDKISPENTKLTCIDLHLPFFGRCDSMQENYRSLHMQFDEDFEKIEFLSASVENIPIEVIAALQHGPLSCKPRFVLYNQGEKKAEIDGADI